ncbi:MAG: hypothetical protein VB013_06665 [Anaerolineaceae bacterium]|nr:hypothetical protein [Anaerolineaceae bacterium]
MKSSNFDKFFESCFGSSFYIIREGVDEKAILGLSGNEKQEAENLLLLNLETEKDSYSRPVIALGLLKSKKAIKPLKNRLAVAQGTDLIQTALALYRIEHSIEAENIIINYIDEYPTDYMTLYLIAGILPQFGKTKNVVLSLLELMEKGDLVGYSATTSLRTLFIDNESIRDILSQILLNSHDAHQPWFVGRKELIEQVKNTIYET